MHPISVTHGTEKHFHTSCIGEVMASATMLHHPAASQSCTHVIMISDSPYLLPISKVRGDDSRNLKLTPTPTAFLPACNRLVYQMSYQVMGYLDVLKMVL